MSSIAALMFVFNELAIGIVIKGGSTVYKHIDRLNRPNQWKVTIVRETAPKIGEYVGETEGSRGEKNVATFAPLYAIEGGLMFKVG